MDVIEKLVVLEDREKITLEDFEGIITREVNTLDGIQIVVRQNYSIMKMLLDIMSKHMLEIINEIRHLGTFMNNSEKKILEDNKQIIIYKGEENLGSYH